MAPIDQDLLGIFQRYGRSETLQPYSVKKRYEVKKRLEPYSIKKKNPADSDKTPLHMLFYDYPRKRTPQLFYEIFRQASPFNDEILEGKEFRSNPYFLLHP